MKLKEIWEAIKRFFISIFRKTQEPEKPTLQELYESRKPKVKVQSLGKRTHSTHNNRKLTRGRYVQYIFLNGISKPIYH
jgi:hypothetical protein